MVRSVGPGGTNINTPSQRRTQERTQTTFPKVGANELREDEKTEGSSKPIMAGAKLTGNVQSIIEEEYDVVRLNADGDRLEVSRRAISLAKAKLYS